MSDIIKREMSFGVGFPQEDEWKGMAQLASACVASGIFSNAKSKEVTIGIFLKARYLNVDPVWALERINPIPAGGRVTLAIDGQGMLALIRRDGTIKYSVEHPDDDTAVCTMLREGDPKSTVIRWTMKDAERAKLLSKENWSKYPKTMLRWRAIVDAARIVCPDLIGGMYFTDEMGVETDEEGSPLDPKMAIEQPVGVLEKPDPKVKELPPIPEPPGGDVSPKKEEPAKPVEDPGKNMSKNFRIGWSQKVLSLGISLGKKIDTKTSALILEQFVRAHNMEPRIEEDGIHLSHLSSEDFNFLISQLKEPGLMDRLKDICRKHVSGLVEDAPKVEGSGDLFKEPKKDDAVSDPATEKLNKDIKELQEAIEKEGGTPGMRLHITILKKCGMIGQGEKTKDMSEKAKSQMSDAYKRLVMGEDVVEITKSYS